MFLKANKKDQSAALLDAAMRKRAFAKSLLDEAEQDIVKSRQLLNEWQEEQTRGEAV